MSTKKTIQINPELFKITGNKTKKNRERKELTLSPSVSPNNLKNKLLNRIKEHKMNETKIAKPILSTNLTNSSSNESNYSDEFYGALDYLSEISKKKKITEAKQRVLNNKTLKNNFSSDSISNPSLNSNISLELPPELQEPIIQSSFVPQSNDVFNVNYKVPDDIPYGCLKNGKKKTYREWKEMTSSPGIDLVRPPTPPKKNLGVFLEGATSQKTNTVISREERLEQIKNKLKKLQDQETQEKQKSIEDFKNLERKFITPSVELGDIEDDENPTESIEQLLKEREETKENENPKKYLKKTIKRKFTLGRSDKLRRVSVLIKDRQTRKNIINTQKDLKKTSITDVKKFLRQRGIIKVGSTCPADILRKTFESVMLTGEVTNVNKETLLHNFMNQES
jgi:hypothetical protein